MVADQTKRWCWKKQSDYIGKDETKEIMCVSLHRQMPPWCTTLCTWWPLLPTGLPSWLLAPSSAIDTSPGALDPDLWTWSKRQVLLSQPSSSSDSARFVFSIFNGISVLLLNLSWQRPLMTLFPSCALIFYNWSPYLMLCTPSSCMWFFPPLTHLVYESMIRNTGLGKLWWIFTEWFEKLKYQVIIWILLHFNYDPWFNCTSYEFIERTSAYSRTFGIKKWVTPSVKR